MDKKRQAPQTSVSKLTASVGTGAEQQGRACDSFYGWRFGSLSYWRYCPAADPKHRRISM